MPFYWHFREYLEQYLLIRMSNRPFPTDLVASLNFFNWAEADRNGRKYQSTGLNLVYVPSVSSDRFSS